MATRKLNKAMSEVENEGRAHPLQGVVEAAFDGVMNAYRAVARDALEYMAAQGLLKRDSDGWYRQYRSTKAIA
jgi:hypothetical protein